MSLAFRTALDPMPRMKAVPLGMVLPLSFVAGEIQGDTTTDLILERG